MDNICKFTGPGLYGALRASCFVMETDPVIMKQENELKSTRVLLLTEGKGELRVGSERLALRQGSLFIGFASERISFQPDERTVYLYIDCDGGRLGDLFLRFRIDGRRRCFEGLEELAPLWQNALARAEGDTIDLVTESVLLYTFSRLTAVQGEPTGLIGGVLRITEERFREPTLSLAAVAEQLCYNPKYLSHAFKRAMKVSYSEYLRDLRIKHAVFLFREGLDSIKNVAFLSGFSDPLYFSATFKRVVGLSPREYVATLGREEDER